MPRVYMRFEWLAGWRVTFLDGDKVLPRTLLFQSEEKLTEMAERGGAMKSLADRQGLEHAIRLGRGGLDLDLSYPPLTFSRGPPLGSVDWFGGTTVQGWPVMTPSEGTHISALSACNQVGSYCVEDLRTGTVKASVPIASVVWRPSHRGRVSQSLSIVQ